MNRLKSIVCCIAGCLTAVACLVSCAGKGSEQGSPDHRFADYVKAYSGGLISSSSPVRIEFAVTPDTGVPAEKLFSFSPSVKGEARWNGTDAVEFIPAEGSLKPGRSYSAVFALDKVFPLNDKSLHKFRFGFTVADREASVEISNVVISASEPAVASVCGIVRLSEPLEREEVLSRMHFSGADKDSEIKLEDGENPCCFRFAVAPVARGDKDRTVSVRFDGSDLKFRNAPAAETTVPASGDFRVLSARMTDAAEPCIEVQFTEPLAELTDRNGIYEVRGAVRTYSKITDNLLQIFCDGGGRDGLSVEIFENLRSSSGKSLDRTFSATFRSNEAAPQVVIPVSGNILPDRPVLPFRTVCLDAVDVKVIKIYKDNVLSFLQDNDLDGDSELRRSGRVVCRKTLRLDEDPDVNLHEWNYFLLDMGGLFKKEKGAIYRVIFSFKKEYSLYGQAAPASSHAGAEPRMISLLSSSGVTSDDEAEWDRPYTYYYEDSYDWNLYDWNDRDNPFTPSYYMVSSRFPAVNLLSTDIGLTAKRADDGHLWLNVNNLLTAEPMSGVQLTAYNFQLRPLASAKSDSEGFAELETKNKAFVVVAEKGESTTYLKVTDGSSNSLSRFDTGGVKIEKGLKGFVYGERGVWRPGDTLHLTLLVDGKAAGLPDNHPAKMELYTPQGQYHSSFVSKGGINGFYTFEVPTRDDDPTGTWNAYFKIGGAAFHKSLPIETVKPNRLKVELQTGTEILESDRTCRMTLRSEWLTGAAASGLSAKSELTLRNGGTSFPSFGKYVFRNPLADFTEQTAELFSGTLDSDGRLVKDVRMPLADNAPGMLKAVIVSRVTEPGGDESIVSSETSFSPFRAYVGVCFPGSGDSYLETDKDNEFNVAVVDCNGRRVKGQRLEYRIYKLSWDWWWETSTDRLASFVNSSSAKIVSSGSLVSGLSDSKISFRVDYPDWGRYLLYVKDTDSGHASGGIFFCDWPAWRGRADRESPEAADMLSFATDKKTYSVGEEATVFIPAAEGGTALVSYENGSKVISREWVRTDASSETAHKFRVTPEMAPNAYIHITLFKPYSSSSKGQIIRMYGVQPIVVSNPSSHLEPLISAPDVIRPQKEFEVKVREACGKKMTYTLAVVDEGILGLTAYKTPDPWSAMNARQALGVSTWDMYSDVIGASVSDISAMFSIGGDEGGVIDGRNRDRRFNPVVKFYGPFNLDRGERRHKITLPMYIGSVRIMVVAGRDGAFGSASKTVPVRNPLMTLASAPRVLGPDEEFSLPVNVFSMEDGVRNVEVCVTAEGSGEIVSDKSSVLKFDGTGDQLCRFRLRTTGKEGALKITVKAVSGSFSSIETVNIDVRNPNPSVLTVSRAAVASGQTVRLDYPDLPGDEDRTSLEITSFPAINFNAALSYADDYEYLCTEQLAARGIAVVSILPMLGGDDRSKAEALVPELLRELALRQLPDGSFSFWPGSATVNLWASAMAGHFMTLASAGGFPVPGSMFNVWKSRETKNVKAYRRQPDSGSYDLLQAYTLYILASAGAAENGAMNRLKDAAGLDSQAVWMLASAYAVAGKKPVAEQMVSVLSTEVSDRSSGPMFGSSVREDAVILEALVLLGQMNYALPVAERLAESIEREMFTTQTAAFSAVAMSRLYSVMKGSSVDAEIVCAGHSETLRSASSLATVDLSQSGNSVSVKNNSAGTVYATVVSRRVPSCLEALPARSSGIGLDVRYVSADGNVIDPLQLCQGTDFYAEVEARNLNPGLDLTDVALTLRVPSGWEIFNERLFGTSVSEGLSYCDVRDDRVTWYFDLPRNASRKFKLRLTAVYEGEFALPQTVCEAMYDNSVFAATASGRVNVSR